MSHEVTLKVFNGTPDESGVPQGEMKTYQVPVEEGMVVLDAIHYIQGNAEPGLSCRWNCKAAKCGSCSAEVNGKPSLMCKTRLDDFDPNESIEVRPIRAFPLIKDLVTDVSWNYDINKRITPFTPPDDNPKEWRYFQEDVDRAQEFRKCIECFLCQDVCHVLRDDAAHQKYAGPRWMVRTASLEMHPMDQADRVPYVKEEAGIGMCNITKCCTEVCPEEIKITDNAIIPLKERVVDRFYDPLAMIGRLLTGGK